MRDSYAAARLPVTADDSFAIASIMGTRPEIRVVRSLGLRDVEASEIAKDSGCEDREEDEEVHDRSMLTCGSCQGFC